MNRPHPLKTYREIQGLTQEALAELIGVTRVTVNRWENGRRPGVTDAERVAEITSIPVVVLLGLDDVAAAQ